MKKIIVLFALLLISGILISQNYVEKVLDFNEIDSALDIIELEEGGYLILAVTTEDDVNKNLFIRLSENGDTLWTKRTMFYGYSIVQYDTSTYYVAGYYRGGALYTYGVLYKLDSNFDRIWIKTYSSSGGDIRFSNLKKNIDNNLTVVEYFKVDDEHVSLYESINVFDSSGVFLNEFADCMILPDYEQLSNKDYVVAVEYENGYIHDYVVITDSAGVFKQKIDVSDFVFDQAEVVSIIDTAYVIGYNNSKGADHVVVYRKDPDYEEFRWVKQMSNLRGNVYSACTGLDNSILIFGYVSATSHSSAYILNVSSSGDSISTSIIDKFPTIYPTKIISNEESYFMISTIEYEDESRDIYFLKAPLDTVLVDIKENPKVLEKNYFSVYPNPASSRVNIVINEENNDELNIVISDIKGKVIYNNLLKSKVTLSISTENWSKGVYFVSLSNKNGYLQSRKLVIE